jgi:CarD family transcriptional regulator
VEKRSLVAPLISADGDRARCGGFVLGAPMAYPLASPAGVQGSVGVAKWLVLAILDGSRAWKDSMEFAVGSKVIYPAHGTAEVIGRSVREVDGEKVTYLELSVAAGDESWRGGALKVSVPEDRAEDLGVRPAISLEEVDDVLAVLAVRSVRVPTNWSRRFKNHQEKMKSGDIYECAEVVRNLALRDRQSSLSSAEKAMQLRARRILVSELAVSWDVTLEEAGERVDAVLADD